MYVFASKWIRAILLVSDFYHARIRPVDIFKARDSGEKNRVQKNKD